MSRTGVAVGAYLLLWLAAILGCSGAGVFLAEDAPPSSAYQRVILLPLNFDRAPAPALAQGAERMKEGLRSYLEEMGYDIVEPRMSTTIGLWRESTAHVGGIEDEQGKKVDEGRYEQARSDLVRRALEMFPADGAVASTVMVRPGRYSGHSLTWDGVARPVRIDNETTFPVLALRGQNLGTSLRTSVFDRAGRKIFERYVGLEPVHRYEAKYRSIRAIQRTDLFQDEALLDESIELSFEPWLVSPTRESE